MTKSVSDGYLMQLWRKAVLSHYHYQCQKCGRVYSEDDAGWLECHHIVRRKHKILRWDYRNGIPGCHDCHQFYHSKRGEMFIAKNVVVYDYLVNLERVTYKQYLVDMGITDNEFREAILKELKAKIEERQLAYV